MDSLTPGTLLAGRFAIESVLGRGGMGQVLRARDKKLGRTVAIKFLPAADKEAGDEPGQARLVREARAAAGLNHPNIIQVFDVGETDDNAVYVVMELVEGRSLRSHMEAGDLPVDEVVRVLMEAARALAAAHRHGVVHRDVKPDNIMVRRDGRAVVLDFGIAKRVHLELRPDLSAGDTQLTQPGTVIGTPSYLSPEQISGGAVTGAADQFALAVTAFEALAGHLPWKNTRPMPLMGEIMMVPAPSLKTERPDLPPELADAIAQALSKKPEQRFADMDLFADALVPFAALGLSSGRASAYSAPPRSSPSPTPVPTPAAPPSDAHFAPTIRASTPDVSPSPDRARPRLPAWAPRVAALAAVTLAVLVGGLAWRSRHAATAAPRAPLEGSRDVVACPVFELASTAPADGWLGAAASNLVCRTTGLGLGDPRRVRLAPTLLDFPRHPTGDAPVDPYAEPDVRARSLAAARAFPWRLDGRVSTAGDRFDIAISLHDRADRVVARGHGAGDDLALAAQSAALEVLTAAADLDRPVDPAVAPWIGTASRRDLLAYTTLDEATAHRSVTRSRPTCERLEHGARPFGTLSTIALAECRLARVVNGVEPGSAPVIPVDRSTPGGLVLTARYHLATNGHDDARALAAALAALPHQNDPYLGSLVSESQAEIAQTLGEPSRARELALAAVEADPQSDLAWARVVTLAVGDPNPTPVFRIAAAWQPERTSAWRWLASDTADESRTVERRRDFASRGYRVAPTYVPVALVYGELLVRTGQPDAARAVAARTRADTFHPAELATLDVLLDASEGHFTRALQRGVAQLLADPSQRLGDQPAMLLEAVMELAVMAGRRHEVADMLADAFLGARPRVSRFGAGPTSMFTLCGSCSPARATACFASVDALVAQERFLSRLSGSAALEAGARAYARGDLAGATTSWRTIARSANGLFRMARPMMVDAFDRSGDAGLAQVLDDGLAAEAPAWAGATMAHYRSARRAIAAGDVAGAHRWGDVLLRQWVTAEGVDQVVADTRALFTPSAR